MDYGDPWIMGHSRKITEYVCILKNDKPFEKLGFIMFYFFLYRNVKFCTKFLYSQHFLD